MDMEYMKPAEIEKRSFEIITQELGDRRFPEEITPVVKRVIHTTADFDYADNLMFSPHAVRQALQAIQDGAHIVTDTNMAKSGINKKILAKFGGEVHCFVAEPDVAAEAKQRGVTRSTVSMERAAKLDVPLIFAIGNAPTALIQLEKLIAAGQLNPELIVGVPVGFVNVVESKERIMQAGVPYIVARGRKGGSNVAAAIVNALLYQLVQREGF
ncbi:MAG: precorrin-8X methylmutase [Clostridiales bacterium]|nr:precorrin-8X methylmutase [Clostridiales bacterium]